MKDSDLIERIRKADPEELKKGLVEELNIEREVRAPDLGAMRWNCYRCSLNSALNRAERPEDYSLPSTLCYHPKVNR